MVSHYLCYDVENAQFIQTFDVSLLAQAPVLTVTSHRKEILRKRGMSAVAVITGQAVARPADDSTSPKSRY
jgi:hypothetical protein